MAVRTAATVLIFSAIMVSCSVKKPAVGNASSTGNAVDYIETYRDLAISEMKRTGVPASITLAQGMVESGYGKSSLALEANNHFGIKCHDNWNGATIRHSDDRRNECFRKYRKADESYRDHSDFLRDTPRYGFLFDLETTDYKGWAKGLKKAGYATNPDYANMLIRKIEQYELNRYDQPLAASRKTENVQKTVSAGIEKSDTLSNGTAGDLSAVPVTYRSMPARVSEKNRVQYIVVNERDTRKSIEQELGLLSWELPRYNELENDFVPVAGQILYLQPKRDRAEAGSDFHISGEGDTMYSISQTYGIKLSRLYLMNRMETGAEPEKGQKLWLRSTKPVD